MKSSQLSNSFKSSPGVGKTEEQDHHHIPQWQPKGRATREGKSAVNATTRRRRQRAALKSRIGKSLHPASPSQTRAAEAKEGSLAAGWGLGNSTRVS